jgi:ABC-type multidrug transport system fused ATPase/permease subunit
VNTLRRVGGFLRPYRVRVATALLLSAFGCLLNLPVPLLVQGLVDRVAAGGRPDLLPAYALGLAAVFAGQALVGLLTTLVTAGVGLGVVRDLRHQLYTRLQRVGLSYYDRTPAGAIISRLMDDVAAVQSFVTGQTLGAVTDLGTTLTVAALLLARGPRLFLAAALFLPIYALTFRGFARRIRAGNTAVRDRLDAVFGSLKQKLDGVLVVKAHARERAETEDFAGQLDAAHGPRVRVGRLGAALSNLSQATSAVGASAVFAVGALEVVHGHMTPGEVVSAAALAGLLFGPIARLADLAAVFGQAAVSVDRLGEILDQGPDVAEPAVPQPVGRACGRVEFDRVGFAYVKGRPVLHDIRLRVEPGMKVALVGPTGCGKTTLMNLLLRFYDPTAGEIRLDGKGLRRLGLADLRRQIGIVPQEPVVFRQSLADNIRYGVPDASDERVEAAGRAALVQPFAAQLPEGYATLVGEGGHKLSQGERQRVAIARAFCKDPALIVLDEATSSLDTPNEALIQAALANLLRGRTAFVIAHRLSTVLGADRIVVLEAGHIVQAGTHAELLAEAGGLYRRLCARQFGLPTGRRAPAAGADVAPLIDQRVPA